MSSCGLTWYGPTEPNQWFHGSRYKGLPAGELLVPQSQGGFRGWTQDPTTPRRDYLYVSQCSAVCALYSTGRRTGPIPEDYAGAVYRVEVEGLVERDTLFPDVQSRCRGARIVADVTDSPFPWREFVEPAMWETVVEMQRAGVAPDVLSGKTTLADVQALFRENQ